jgi:hypothetical protein
MCAALLGTLRAEAWALIGQGRDAQAEVLVLESPETLPSNADIVLVARLNRHDAIGAASVLLDVLEQLDGGGVPAMQLSKHIDRRSLMPWGLAPYMPEGVERDALLDLLLKPREHSTRVDGVRGALRSMITGSFDQAAKQAPTPWRDAALAIAGNAQQRRQARHRLARDEAEGAELAWRLHIIGRSFLQEGTPGHQRRGLVHLARIAAEPSLREAHPRLALHALRTLVEHNSGEARLRLAAAYNTLRTALRIPKEDASCIP